MAVKSTQKESEFYLTRTEMERVIYAAPNFRDRCLLKLLWKTGMRRAEIRGVDVRDVDFDKNLIQIREGKGSKTRIVPFDDELKSDLLIYLGKRKAGPLFISNKGNPISVRAINDVVARAGVKAGVKHPNPRRRGINPHLFRHTCLPLEGNGLGGVQSKLHSEGLRCGGASRLSVESQSQHDPPPPRYGTSARGRPKQIQGLSCCRYRPGH